MELSLIRKGKTNIPQERIIYLLQINKNHVCYIKNISIFLKRFYNVAKDREICRNCFVQFKNKSEYNNHVTSKVCIYRIPFPTKIVLPPKNSKMSFKSLGKTLPPILYATQILKACYSPTMILQVVTYFIFMKWGILHTLF